MGKCSISLFRIYKSVIVVVILMLDIGKSSMLSLLLILILLVLSGNIEVNPGPPPTVTKIKSLTACHINIRGLSPSKLWAIKANLCDTYDIITIPETFLSLTSRTDLTLPGFHNIIRKDRPTFGGGVAIYIRENISFKRKAQYEDRSLEVIWVEVNKVEGKVLIGTAYRPPNSTYFWEHFERNLDVVKSHRDTKYILVMGDLNADFKDVHGNHLLNLCAIQNLKCLIKEPTRITATTQTCLDQILVNMPNFVKDTSVTHPVSTNDHCTVAVVLNFSIPQEKPYNKLIWNYEQGDYDSFKTSLIHANWDECFVSGDVDKNMCKMVRNILKHSKDPHTK